jgi:hypothetical protein
MRTGRLRLPEEVAGLTPDDVPTLSAVDGFADRLAEEPLATWLSIGGSIVDTPSNPLRSTSFAILEATINAGGLAVAAWYVRDAIDTSAYYASPPLRRWTARERRCFAAAHAAAEEAALALLARDLLSADDFGTLCTPFGDFIRQGNERRR